MMDAAQLAEELRSEQEHAQVLERERREQDAKAKDLQVILKLLKLKHSISILSFKIGPT